MDEPTRKEWETAADHLAQRVALWFGEEAPAHGTPEADAFMREMLFLTDVVLGPYAEDAQSTKEPRLTADLALVRANALEEAAQIAAAVGDNTIAAAIRARMLGEG